MGFSVGEKYEVVTDFQEKEVSNSLRFLVTPQIEHILPINPFMRNIVKRPNII